MLTTKEALTMIVESIAEEFRLEAKYASLVDASKRVRRDRNDRSAWIAFMTALDELEGE